MLCSRIELGRLVIEVNILQPYLFTTVRIDLCACHGARALVAVVRYAIAIRVRLHFRNGLSLLDGCRFLDRLRLANRQRRCALGSAAERVLHTQRTDLVGQGGIAVEGATQAPFSPQ